MTTILNGSTIFYNRGGCTIDTYTATGTNITASSTTIVRSAQKTIAIMINSSTAYGFNLPIDAEVGDEVEVFMVTTNFGGWYHLPSGETLLDGSTASGGCGGNNLFRKLSSTAWALLSV